MIVTYAFDLPDTFQMASFDAIAELGIPLPEVRQIAVANLKRNLPQIGFADHGPFRRIVTGENLEACTLLATSFWDQIADETDGEIVVAVPNRDLVLFCGNRSIEGVKALREAVAEVLAEDDNHNLSEHLFAWRGQRWVLYDA